jgi:hypothetical protein
MAIQTISIVRWLARIIGTFLFLALMGFVLGEGLGGEGFPNFVQLSATELIGFLAMFLIAAGMLMGWKWERLGGLLNLVGVATFLALELIINHRIHFHQWPFFILAIPGILYLICGVWPKRSAAAELK